MHLPIGGVRKRHPFVNLEKLLSDKSLSLVQKIMTICAVPEL